MPSTFLVRDPYTIFGAWVLVKEWGRLWKCWGFKWWECIFEESLVSFIFNYWFSIIRPNYNGSTWTCLCFHLFPRNVNYITSWLSIVGPVVGLNLPLSYARAASQNEWNVDWQGKKQSLDWVFAVTKTLVSLLHVDTLSHAGPTIYEVYFHIS